MKIKKTSMEIEKGNYFFVAFFPANASVKEIEGRFMYTLKKRMKEFGMDDFVEYYGQPPERLLKDLDIEVLELNQVYRKFNEWIGNPYN